ncbi:MAG: hypothetical protein EXS36_19450 [Pedosphaera sp.]|nr:hypothetical protein [Pedosphaera sp.]
MSRTGTPGRKPNPITLTDDATDWGGWLPGAGWVDITISVTETVGGHRSHASEKISRIASKTVDEAVNVVRDTPKKVSPVSIRSTVAS